MSSKREASRRLARLTAEYDRALSEVAGLPNGNGYVTQERMGAAVRELYSASIAAAKRKAGVASR